jgi:hypothetical protein
MTALLPILTSAWKFVLGRPTLIVAILLGIALSSVYLQKRHAENERDILHDRIHDEDTGYIVRLAQSRANAATLADAIDTQNTALSAITETHDELLEQARKHLLQASDERDRVLEQIFSVRSAELNGETVCERVIELDEILLAQLGGGE